MIAMTMDEISQYVKACHRCPLANTRTNTVTGDGNPQAKIMLIGEGPGEQEDLQGRAFVGKAGQLLDKMLASIGLDRTTVYICNIVKCRPPHNRNPLPQEVDACIDYLRAQYLAVRPQLIILLGSVACKALLDEHFSITRQHGVPIERKGVTFLPTFHPAALLRDESKKALAWEDLKIAKKFIDEHDLLQSR